MKSIAKNYLYNVIYQIVQIVVPVILTPYVARVLGVEGSGRYSFSYSITSYFLLIAAFGFRYYAQRLVASHQGNRKLQSVDFWELVLVRLIPVGIALIAYIGLIVLGFHDDANQILLFILTLDIVAVAFDISFLFQGNEEFGKIVLQSCIVKVTSVIMIIVFVKTANDLCWYAFIMAGSSLVNALVLWAYVPGMLEKCTFRELHPLKHLKPAAILFLPTIAISVYTSLDKTMIGLITHSNAENGIYEYADKIVKIFMTLVTSLGTVIVPRNSKHFASKENQAIKENTQLSLSFVFFLGIPLLLGLIATADMIIPWFLGSEYTRTAALIKILAPLVVVIGCSNLFGVQLLIPSQQDKKFMFSITLGAVCNFLLNLLLIRYMGSYGAAVASLIAESVITLVMFYFVREYVSLRIVISVSWKPLLSGVIMFVPCAFLGYKMQPTIINTMIVAVVGVVIYMGVLLVLKDAFLMNAIQMVKNRVYKRHEEKEQ